MEDLRFQKLDNLVSFFRGEGPVVVMLSKMAPTCMLESFMDISMEQLLQTLTRALNSAKAHQLLQNQRCSFWMFGVCVLRKFRDRIIDCHNGRSLSPAWSLWQDSCTGSHQRMKTFPSDCQPSLRLLHWIAYLILMDGLCQAMFWWTLQQSGRAQWRIRSMRSSIRYHKDRGTYNFDLTWFEFPM